MNTLLRLQFFSTGPVSQKAYLSSEAVTSVRCQLFPESGNFLHLGPRTGAHNPCKADAPLSLGA